MGVLGSNRRGLGSNCEGCVRVLTMSFCHQLLLDLARVIFEEQSNLPQLIHKVMRHTQEALRCEQCHVLLLDEVSHVSDHHCAATKCHAVLINVVMTTDGGCVMSDHSPGWSSQCVPWFISAEIYDVAQ